MLVAMLLVAAVVGLWPYRHALFVAPQSLAQVAEQLEPYYQLFTPSGEGPFPAVAVFHGCAGPEPGLSLSRATWLNQQGYVALLVDSYSGRGLRADEVCSGHRLWGNQRVNDVHAALAYLRTRPQVDPQRMALMGYSHGGWTVLDALAYGDKRPMGALEPQPDGLLGVKAVVAYYPYCEFPAHFATGWQVSVPVLGLLAGQDSVVDVQACLSLFDRQQVGGAALEYELYPAADHVFDGEGSQSRYDPLVAEQALARVAQFLARHFQQ
ncbi:dienelactone hydrolase family protein [Aestuariirhabdus litorea]|uniref:Dienelactone hydrolase family protein n=1 Tax=Aestuariirhabdus litorea TaxID=2528527 RepID=A0A3P3VID6_9GAMM|nr:dienelactone hydrolase family protein [Aestuariirhabdus litorea]